MIQYNTKVQYNKQKPDWLIDWLIAIYNSILAAFEVRFKIRR